jgi:hypothetical protein
MSKVNFLKGSGINVIAEFHAWANTSNKDAALQAPRALAKLEFIAEHGLQYLDLYQSDTCVPPDLYFWQKFGWACFYAAYLGPAQNIVVAALHIAELPPGPIHPLELEAKRRRKLFNI